MRGRDRLIRLLILLLFLGLVFVVSGVATWRFVSVLPPVVAFPLLVVLAVFLLWIRTD
ncbi:hypothetical protein [Bifidobacterium sp. UBA4282]|uniref:hypothetical protein n=1 Tax=Bifidobacterium sp. UBA4282 TaxID=1946096 RepID=UPI0025BB57EB|nr:hypothetical protein [Bifidobacterium sp. UBA4282]